MKRSDSDRGQADTLRDTLRAQTRESHHRVDHLIGALDLTSLEGMSDFLATNYLAYSSVKERLKPYEGFTLPLLPLDEIEADLDVLGRSVPRWRVPPFGEARLRPRCVMSTKSSRIGARDCRVSGKIGPLKPGAKYVVNFLVQHEDPAKLESIRDGECWLDSELSKSIDVPVYGTAQAAYARDNSSSFKDVRLAPGDKKVAFAAPPDESKLPSEAAPGDLLTGTAGLCRSAANSEGPSRRPAAGMLYQVPPRSNKTAKKASSKKDAPAKKAARKMSKHHRSKHKGKVAKVKQGACASCAAPFKGAWKAIMFVVYRQLVKQPAWQLASGMRITRSAWKNDEYKFYKREHQWLVPRFDSSQKLWKAMAPLDRPSESRSGAPSCQRSFTPMRMAAFLVGQRRQYP